MRYTPWVFWTLIGLAAGYDTFARLHFGVDATFSRMLLRWHVAHPGFSLALALAVGVLIGHLFVPQVFLIRKG